MASTVAPASHGSTAPSSGHHGHGHSHGHNRSHHRKPAPERLPFVASSQQNLPGVAASPFTAKTSEYTHNYQAHKENQGMSLDQASSFSPYAFSPSHAASGTYTSLQKDMANGHRLRSHSNGSAIHHDHAHLVPDAGASNLHPLRRSVARSSTAKCSVLIC